MKMIYAVLGIILLLTPSETWAKLNIVATTTDLGYLAQKAGGSLVEVKTLARGDQDVHFLEPKPSFILAASRAELLIYNGLEFEAGWLPILITQSKNPVIQSHQPGNLDASRGILVIEIPAGPVDRSMGDVHPQGNPHYLLDPRNALIVLERISERLGQLDPANKARYTAQSDAYASLLKQKIQDWARQAQSLKGQKIVTHHKSFNYLFNWLGLKNVAYLEPKPGLPPTSSHLMRLVTTVKEEHIPLIISESYYDPKPGRELAAKTGAKAIELPPSVGGTPDVPTYESLFEHILGRLTAELK